MQPKARIGRSPASQHVLRFLQSVALIALCGCHSPQYAVRSPAELLAARTNYPAHWWTPVPTNGAPTWETLPQAAAPGEVILSKRHELGLLSNFAATPFTFRGQRYASLEGFWQMMKYPETNANPPAGFPGAESKLTQADDPRAKFPGIEWRFTREQVAQLTAFDAKRAGDLAEQNMKQMDITWVTFEGKRMEYRENARGEFYQLIAAATREKVRQNPEVKKVLLATGDLVLKPDHHQGTNTPPAWRYFEILTEIRGELQKWNLE
ncbi:MAG: NADAR family protein [Pedosphaera sp.]|nr:NADAR family protein [Pedosphaera sp.]